MSEEKPKSVYEKWDIDAQSGDFMKGYPPGKAPSETSKTPGASGGKEKFAADVKRLFGADQNPRE